MSQCLFLLLAFSFGALCFNVRSVWRVTFQSISGDLLYSDVPSLNGTIISDKTNVFASMRHEDSIIVPNEKLDQSRGAGGDTTVSEGALSIVPVRNKPRNKGRKQQQHQQPRQSTSRSNNIRQDLFAFLPENIVMSGNTTTCGASKCFYKNKHDESIGYLVTPFLLPERKMLNGKTTWYNIHVKAYVYAIQLQHDYGVKHFYLEPPIKVNVSPELYKTLNYKTHTIGFKPPKKKYGKRFKEGSSVLIQKVANAPKPNVFLGSMRGKRKIFERNVQQFIESISDKQEFYMNFLRRLDELKDLLKREPCLADDFQAILDEHGDMYHIDLERCFEPQRENKDEDDKIDDTKNALEALESIKRTMEKALGKS